ncbi:phage minor head protein [Sphingomonas cavernae]|uniref:Phage head protein n=1 Tax=Sphingomonas cavernae TaxID=2320861 RepID=A0A418WMC2_9SPHN|nr:phage minor head protein [Sphingomonas cavernae]RJF91146.1 phage head protein [Sphingomonas cavernae]
MPEQHPSTVSGALKKPFAEQVAFFRAKLGNLVPTERWDDLWEEQHDTGFMVAGAAKADLLSDLGAAVDRAIAEGKSLDAFRKDFRTIVEKHGWHGWTGEDTAAGRAWRTRTIYRTNAATSYSAGRRVQLEQGNFFFWIYRHGGSEHPRLVHLSWNGLALPPAHPFWGTHYPPSAFNCSCYVVGARSERGVRRLGGEPGKALPKGWNAIDPKTGAPTGIGKGWGYAPGASVATIVQAMAEKVRQWDYRIAKAFMDSVPARQRDALAASYRSLPSTADDARRYAQRVIDGAELAEIAPVQTLGLLSSAQSREIGTMKGADVDLFDFSLAPSDIKHVRRQHGDDATEARQGQRAIVAQDYAVLPTLLNKPDAIEDAGTSDLNEPLVRLVREIHGERFNAVFAVRRGRRTLALKTMYVHVKRGAPPR